MIIGIGIDVISVERIKKIIDWHGDNFAEKILSFGELSEYRQSGNQIQYLASRFSLKEALIKALKSKWSEFEFSDIEIKNEEKGAPEINLSPKLYQHNPEFKEYKIFASISHEENIIVTQVLIEKN